MSGDGKEAEKGKNLLEVFTERKEGEGSLNLAMLS